VFVAQNAFLSDIWAVGNAAFFKPREEFMKAYKKEMRSTIAFGVIYVLLAHTGMFTVLIGGNNDIRLLGFPIHYFIAIVLGSFGVLLVSIIWSKYANRLEDKIEAENQKTMGAGE